MPRPLIPATFTSFTPGTTTFASFLQTQCDRSGNESRNALIRPGLMDCDFSVVNNIPFKAISENFNAQFRTEFFNILNRPNFQSPNDNRTIMDQSRNLIPFAGAIRLTNTTSRQLQFALKLSW